jgi:Ribonuclease G/E
LKEENENKPKDTSSFMTLTSKWNEKMKVGSIVAREVKLQAELNKANEIIEKLNNEQDSPFLLYKEFKEEKEKILKDEVEQLKAENTNMKEENKTIEARSIVDQKRAQTFKDEYEISATAHFKVQRRLCETEDCYNELKDRHNKMKDLRNINDEDDDDTNNINNGTNHDDDSDDDFEEYLQSIIAATKTCVVRKRDYSII